MKHSCFYTTCHGKKALIRGWNHDWPVVNVRNLDCGDDEGFNYRDALERINFAPHFKACWYEMGILKYPYGELTPGILMTSSVVGGEPAPLIPLTFGEKFRHDLITWDHGLTKIRPAIEAGSKWVTTMIIFTSAPNIPGSVPLHFGIFGIREDGYVHSFQDYAAGVSVEALRQNFGREATPTEITTMFLKEAWPVLHATDLLNSKNVTIAEKPLPPKIRKKREKHGQPTYSFKRLVVRVKQDDTRWLYPDHKPQPTELPRHHVRGHFKNYTEDRPLFGKYTGRYWWNPQWRGLEKIGKVVKVYDVRNVE